jgi:3-hydroxyisobutyrate dehydrogenase
MGGALARRLQLTHRLHVFDKNPTAVDALVEQGAVAYTSLQQLASNCDIIFMCLPTSTHVQDAVFGPQGIAEGMRPGTLIIDQTTGDPKVTRKIAEQLAEAGADLIDAPVSGGAQGAQAGTIAIMVGASQELYDRALPVLRNISSTIFHAGEVGAGQVIKLVNNLLSGAQRLVTMEAVALAAKNGLDPEVACNILLSGGAKNAFLEKFMAPHVIKGNLSPGFTLGLMHKDVRLACDLASDSGVPLYFGGVAREFYQMCISEQGADAQVHTAALVFDKLAGTHVVPQTVS